MGIAENISKLKSELGNEVLLVAVSKYSTDEAVQEAYDSGQLDFGENKAQDLTFRKDRFPERIRWHFIGHLQRNKVKYIAPFIHLIHSVDSLRLLREINKQAEKNDRIIPVLLQIHIAKEESKFGLDEAELKELIEAPDLVNLKNIRIEGLMGMATNTSDMDRVKSEFDHLKTLFDRISATETVSNIDMKTLSMGMTGDYKIAVESGSNMVRIGSAIFK